MMTTPAKVGHPRPFEHAIDLLRVLIGRDLKMKYKRSYLGFAWSLMNPLAQLLIFVFLFRKVLPLNIPHYATFVFIGVISWSWFSSSLSAAGGAIVNNGAMVRRPGFPVAMLPVLTVASNGVHFLLAVPILLVFAAIDGAPMGAALLLLPGLILLQFFMSVALAYLISSANVYFRDTEHLVGIAVMLGFYMTPVFYSAEALPPAYRLVYGLNPMARMLDAYRDVIIHDRPPQLLSMLILLAVSTALFLAGRYVFRHSSANFVEQI